MWEILKATDKNKYKLLITNFASLSEAFSQKSDEVATSTVAPIVNSKFQETVFQRSFNAVGEDISNTSYDASVIVDKENKFLVGIKSFGLYSGDQKIAQFKSNSVSDNWELILNEIRLNAKRAIDKQEADKINEPLYKELATKIATLRNNRIASSKELIKGFKVDDVTVQSVYHVLMPSKKDQKPQIFVGETNYSPIDIDNLTIIGSTNKSTPNNFKFTDGIHQYKYTSADSQLYMSFKNQEIIVDAWDVHYNGNPFELFETLHERIPTSKVDSENRIEQTISWMICKADGTVEENSGFNAFDGGSKLAKNVRQQRIDSIKEKYSTLVNTADMNFIISYLTSILLSSWNSIEDKRKRKELRDELIDYLEKLGNFTLLKEVESLVYRPVSEVYIPIPDSKNFHTNNPDFFGPQIGTFKEGTDKLLLPKEKRIFKLEFMASGDVIDAYINQDAGKSIQSYSNQQILGEWLLRKVFQLKEREPLTGQRLIDIGINGIRLNKFKDNSRGIGLEFIWIDSNNPPADAIGWVKNFE